MSKMSVGLLALACALGLLLRSSDSPAEATSSAQVDASKEKQAVQKVLDDQVVAWNNGNLEGFMEGYWNSPELTFYSTKGVTKGWQATLDRYRKKYQGEGKKMGKLSFREVDVEILGADHALVRGRWHVVLPDETVEGLFTLICKKLAAGWRIVHDHTS
jgi:ketosteroid isomerase-like protein